ncbi:transglutaminase-like domain-containing protein [Faecalibacterium sp. An121]|uniref:transglutaminase-like domain-containing protein n=1 Tax=Faecalibacterium sp. An121 TaxID=1965550 RepID=UPI000B37C5BA|nr:transglutaminase-like domain-containing protein [Faecalibacterium sp. An121]OUQ40851.1 transglutaminase-like enzyme, cysteine protease [Faecalibacterium sp. An121]
MPRDLNETFRSLNEGLPGDIARLKAAGYFAEAIARIDERLAEDWSATQNGPGLAANPTPRGPDGQREAMTAQREIMRRLPLEYPYDQQQAVAKMQARVPDFTLEELQALERAGRVDWRFVEGEKHYLDRFDETLLDTDPSFAARQASPPPRDGQALARRRAVHQKMKQRGSARARITLATGVGMSDQAFARALARAKAEGRDSVHVRAWLPLPAACRAQSDIRLEEWSVQPTLIALADVPQRTAYWEADLTENRFFTARYSYISTARYIEPMDAVPDSTQPSFDTAEEPPHIVFTPFLRALAAQLTQGVTSPVEKARRFYDYITLNVRYHYQPSYFVLEDIPTCCAADRRGDCGVMALTFITLCRIAGIPAKWQSGLAVGPGKCGCHDWAKFYIEPWGWMYADCSYGASMARAGEEELRRHYFGSLDPGRMVANRAFGAPFDSPMYGFRADPYDNQTGEVEADGVGLYGDQVVSTKETLCYEELD